jgi:hypothetical protein
MADANPEARDFPPPPNPSEGVDSIPLNHDLRALQAAALAHRAALEEALFGAYEEESREERIVDANRLNVAKIERKAAINARKTMSSSRRRRRSSRLAGVVPTIYNLDDEFEDDDDDDFEGDEDEDDGDFREEGGSSSQKRRRRRSSGAGVGGLPRRWGESTQGDGFVPIAPPRQGVIRSRPIGPREEGSMFACHWCRHPRNMEWIRCALCRSVLFCSRCYGARHCVPSKRGDEVRAALSKKASWICPPCRGACNCSGQGSKAHLYKLTGNLPSGSMAAITKLLDKDVNTILETTEWRPPNASYTLPKIKWPGKAEGRFPWARYDQEYIYQLSPEQVRDLSHIYAWLPDSVVLSRLDNNVAPWTDAEIAIVSAPHTDTKYWTEDWPVKFAERAQPGALSPSVATSSSSASSSSSNGLTTDSQAEIVQPPVADIEVAVEPPLSVPTIQDGNGLSMTILQ